MHIGQKLGANNVETRNFASLKFRVFEISRLPLSPSSPHGPRTTPYSLLPPLISAGLTDVTAWSSGKVRVRFLSTLT